MDDSLKANTPATDKVAYQKPEIRSIGSLKNIIHGASGSAADFGFETLVVEINGIVPPPPD